MINQWTQCQNILRFLHDFWSDRCFARLKKNWKLNENNIKNTVLRQNKNDYSCLI